MQTAMSSVDTENPGLCKSNSKPEMIDERGVG